MNRSNLRTAGILSRLELKNLLAGRAAPLGLLLFLLAGAYGLHHGRTVVDRQREVLAASPALEREHVEYLNRIYPADRTETGSLLYYRFFHTHHEPTAWSAASLGLRDVNPFNLKVRLLTLQGQLYDSDLANPTAQSAGNLDLAFVLIFLLPLLIIALTYNVLSAEEEQDTWRLLWAQPVAVARVFALKLAVRLGVVLGVCALLLAAAVAYLGLPLDGRLSAAAGLVLAYLLFWFAAALVVVSLRRSSDFNALALVGTWLGLTILAPALLNAAAAARFPVPEALEVTVRQRQGYHRSWDLPRDETMEAFHRRYPEMAAYPVPDDRFSWGWYYAMNQRGDDAAEETAALYRRRLEARHHWIRRAALLVPPLGVQLAMNRLAGTDLTSHLSYLDSVREHHEALKRALYPMVFREGMADRVDWEALPRHHFAEEGDPLPALPELGMLLALAAGLIASGLLRMARMRVEPRQGRDLRPAAAATGAGILALLLSSAAASAQQAAPEGASGSPAGRAPEAAGIIDLPRLPGPITLDGVPDEPAWEAIQPLPLTQYSPVYGGTPAERTELRVAYDDRYLYVSAVLHERDPSRIDAYSLTRDRWNGDDTFGVLLDTFRDGETGVRFILTPLGVRIDNSISDGGETISYSWDTFWDGEARVGANGWTGEMRIPFTSLRFARSEGEVVMGMMVYRWTTRSSERVTFPAIRPEFKDTRPASMQQVRLRGIEVRRPVVVTPYALGGVGQESVLPPGATRWGLHSGETLKFGGDVKFAPTPGLNLDLTLNTDFADVEVDQQQVNLTRFPLFFPEKRAFFLEREGLFAFSTGAGPEGRLFHSRRIGLVGGEPVPILGGARLVGRVAGTDVGALTMQTSGEGNPSESFGVARVRRQVLNRTSHVGAMATSRVASGNGPWNVTYGMDATLNPFGDDYFTIKWLQTLADQDSAGHSAGLDAARIVLDWSRRRIRGLSYSTTLTRSGPGYDPAVGFEPNRDFTRVGSSLDHQWFFGEGAPLRRLWVGNWGNAWVRNEDGRLDNAWLHPFVWLQTRRGDVLRLSTSHSYDSTREGFRLSSDAEVPPGDYRMDEAWLQYTPPEGWRLQPRLTLQAGEYYDGTKARMVSTLLWRASAHLELEGDYQLNRIQFPDRDQRFVAHLLGARARVAWNPRLSTGVFLQYNSTIDRLTSNARLRWNVREGRDLWVVWNEGVNTDRDSAFSGDPRLPFTHGRTFTMKYSHAVLF